MMPTGATLRNAYRARKGDGDREDALKVPQSFSFMRREGLGGLSKQDCLKVSER